jgi:sulfatase maturation enzyme AslB (radical SAM superfamily)
MNEQSAPPKDATLIQKFKDPHWTAKGEERAVVPLNGVATLWFNTGTLCNIACTRCYIESSPENDRLVYLTEADVTEYLDQIPERNWPVDEIGLTGGEPFMNPDIIPIMRAALERGYRLLVLTNAMRPMMRPRIQQGLIELQDRFPDTLTLRISLDHFSADHHDEERGTGAFKISLEGMRWLRDHGFRMAVAGRSIWGDTDQETRDGFAKLFAEEGFNITASNPAETVIFPEMDESVDVPEITTACWDILGKSPKEVMCASSRMIVKRKGAESPSVVSCTLLPYSEEFEMGPTLADAEKPVALNHPHCAKFCVLGGASCSA